MENLMPKIKCAGTGLIALDVLIDSRLNGNPKIFVGGSCGNVMTILSYLGCESFPIARLGINDASDFIIEDLVNWGVDVTFIDKDEKGSTPVIIHRILESQTNEPKHRFEFKNPNNGKWFPSFRPVLAKKIGNILDRLPQTDIFYFDRVSRSAIELAKMAKAKGALIFFEPSANSDKKQFEECLKIADIIKFSNDRLKTYKQDYPKIQSLLEIESLGSRGLSYRFKSDSWKIIDSFQISNAVDTAGAGDWCSSGILKYLMDKGLKNINDAEEINIVEALCYGQALGAINCLYPGARGSMYQMNLSKLEEICEMILNGRPFLDSINTQENYQIDHHKEQTLELDILFESI